MKTIWYFVGLIMLAMGIVIIASGIYLIFNPPEHRTVFGDSHPDIWWGAIMSVVGLIYLISSKGKRV